MTDAHDPVLFVSGAGLWPWIWDGVRSRLGVDSTVAPRPAGHARASLKEYAEAAAEAAPAGPFTLVAHSAGGVIGAEVTRLLSSRVTTFLGISAVVPDQGGSFVSSMPAPNRWVLAAAMRVAGTRPPASAIRRGLTGGLPDDVADRIVNEFSPESARLYRDRMGEHTWAGRRGFLFTTVDKELPAAVQRRSAERLGATWAEELATGHLPMLEDPPATAAAIRRFLAAGG